MSIDPAGADPGYGDAVIRQLEHEDGLTINRLSWLVASQSFLFTAYAIVLNGLPLARDPFVAVRQGEMLRLVPALGLATSGLIHLGLLAGLRVTLLLRRALREERRRAGAAPLPLPLIFFAAWALLLLE